MLHFQNYKQSLILTGSYSILARTQYSQFKVREEENVVTGNDNRDSFRNSNINRASNTFPHISIKNLDFVTPLSH